MATDSNSLNEDNIIPESRYMTSMKKRYYLASVDENVEILRKEQINKLTDILINLKSEYDALVREGIIKNKETEEICKKIGILDRMDKKTKKKNDEVSNINDTIKEAIEVKKKKLNEELYTKKSMISLLETMKNDILIDKKKLCKKEEQQKYLRARYQKEKLYENDIREMKNSVFNKMTTQKKKNIFDKNEYNLQLHYYQTIIEHKWMFIKSADERKERQTKISQEAKNDSQDKQEIETRKILCMLYLVDNYLKFKMNNILGQSSEIEESFQKIKDICGTANLKTMVNKIINKDKRYNYCVSRVTEQEKSKKIIIEEIAALTKKFDTLKSQVVVDENTVGTKDIKTINILNSEQNNLELLEKELELNEQYLFNQEMHKGVLTVYDQVVSNIKKLCQINTNIGIDNSGINITNANETSINNSQSQYINSEESIANAYNDYLNNSEKTIDILFLCHSRQEFLKMLREKALELGVNKSKTRFSRGQLFNISKNTSKEKNVSVEYNYQYEENEENLNSKEKDLQNEIFNAYLNEIRSLRYDYVNNVNKLISEKEKKNKTTHS